VLDEDGEYFGCLSVNDLLKSLYQREFITCSWAPSKQVEPGGLVIIASASVNCRN